MQVGDIDVLAVETMPPLAKQQVVHMGEVKTGTHDSPTKAGSKVDTNTAAIQKAATDPSAEVMLEANGVDITEQVDLASATRDKGQTYCPSRRPAGPKDAVFDNNLGITSEDLERLARALLEFERRTAASTPSGSGSP